MAVYFFIRAYFLGCLVFIPTFVIAAIMLRAPLRALGMSLAFTAGGALAFATALVLGSREKGQGVLNTLPDTLLGNSMAVAYACAAAVGGGVLALYLFNKFVRPPGQHS